MNQDKPVCKEQCFYICQVCGNLMIKLNDSGINPQCCGRDMTVMKPGEKEAPLEKHKPIWHMEGNKVIVKVGEEPHPMSREHYIEWIFVKTNLGYHIRKLNPECDPEACFKLCSTEWIEEVYSYCNLHGLWKADKENC